MYLQKIFTTLLVFSFITFAGVAQQTSLHLQDGYQVRVDGDSNVRTWGADAETVTGSLTLNTGEINLDSLTPENFASLEIAVVVESLDSGTRGLNSNMHKYLKGDDHPQITFVLNNVTNIDVNGNQATLTANGVINAAGQNHNVTLSVLAEIPAAGSIQFSGEHEMLMTDFDIEPPTAVFGTVRSHDEIVISYNVIFSN